MCEQESSSDNSRKIYTRKELVMMDTTIYDFCTSFYIPAIQNLAFHLPHVRILGTNHYGAMKHKAFKWRELFQYVLCRLKAVRRIALQWFVPSMRTCGRWKANFCMAGM